MSRMTFAQIRSLSSDSPNPARVSWAMHELLCSNMKLTRRVLTKNLLTKLMHMNCGTNEVERYAQIVSNQSVRKCRSNRIIKEAMKFKVQDAKFDEKQVRNHFVKCKIEYSKVVKRGSMVDIIFNREAKESMETIRNVMYADRDLIEMVNSRHTDREPIVYGNVEISENVKEVLKMSPNFMMYKNIDVTEIEVEIEKGLCKARYALMNDNVVENNEDFENESERNRRDECEVYDSVGLLADYSNLRVTDLPTCQRLYPLKPAAINKELHMQNLREKLLRKVEEYKQKRCSKNGAIKKRNVSSAVFEGLKEISQKVKEKEMVVFCADKSGHLSVDSVNNYENALNEHTKDDIKINETEVRKIEAKMNNHLKQFNKMFCVGSTWGHEDRIAGASTSTNIPPPPKYGLRKDHKPVQPGEEHVGPPVRPVAGATEAPNSRFSHFLSMIVNSGLLVKHFQ